MDLIKIEKGARKDDIAEIYLENFEYEEGVMFVGKHRYLITRAGQEVYNVVEGILHRVNQVGDVQAGRLRDIHRALQHVNSLCKRGLDTLPDGQLVEAVRAVFDPHESFSTQITQIFASINQWQSRSLWGIPEYCM